MATHYPVPRNVKASEVEESEASRIDFLDVHIKEIHLRYIMPVQVPASGMTEVPRRSQRKHFENSNSGWIFVA
jgi:hypothetical protein